MLRCPLKKIRIKVRKAGKNAFPILRGNEFSILRSSCNFDVMQSVGNNRRFEYQFDGYAQMKGSKRGSRGELIIKLLSVDQH